MGTIFKNVLLEDDTGGGCEVLTDIPGEASPSPTDEIEIVCSVNIRTYGSLPILHFAFTRAAP